MELAWHTQKNQMSDVKGKEMEQERKGKIKNEDIDLERTKLNYDLISSDKNLYQRVKDRVEFAKENGSRVQKNSVVMYSNILTVPQEQFNEWGKEKTAEYFKACRDFFAEEFGKENVVSAKVHLDETTPHMHLHFVPFNKENGKLQARTSMNKQKVNEIHDSLPKFLRERGFDVERGKGKTVKNIEDIHEYKEVQRTIADKRKELNQLQLQTQKIIKMIPTKEELNLPLLEKEIQIQVTPKLFGKPEIEKIETGNYVITPHQYEMLEEKLISVETLKNQNDYLLKENNALTSGEKYQSLAKESRNYLGLVVEKNNELHELKQQNETLTHENKELKSKNSLLLAKVDDLKLEIGLFYAITKNYLKERVKTPEAFQNIFKGLVGAFKGHVKVFASQNENKGFKSHLNDLYEADKDFSSRPLEKVKEKDRGMER